MNKEEVLKAIMELPKIETNNPISAMNSISIDDLMSAIDRFDKVPTYDELLKENKQLKEVIEEVREHCNQEIKSANIQYERDKRFMHQQYIVYHERVLQILDKGESNEKSN